MTRECASCSHPIPPGAIACPTCGSGRIRERRDAPPASEPRHANREGGVGHVLRRMLDRPVPATPVARLSDASSLGQRDLAPAGGAELGTRALAPCAACQGRGQRMEYTGRIVDIPSTFVGDVARALGGTPRNPHTGMPVAVPTQEREKVLDRCRWCSGTGHVAPIVNRAFAYHEGAPFRSIARAPGQLRRPGALRGPTRVGAFVFVAAAALGAVGLVASGTAVSLGTVGALIWVCGALPRFGAIALVLVSMWFALIGAIGVWRAPGSPAGYVLLGLAVACGFAFSRMLPAIDRRLDRRYAEDPMTMDAFADADDPARFLAAYVHHEPALRACRLVP